MNRIEYSSYGTKLPEATSLRRDETTESEKVRNLREEYERTPTDVSEITPTQAADGNGGLPSILWDVITPTPTFQTAQEIVSTSILAELAETSLKLNETQKENQKLTEFRDYWLSSQYDSEALVISDDDAIAFLVEFADKEALPLSTITKLFDRPEQWLSVVRLAQAKFINYLGSYLYITDRGKQVLDAILERDSTELEI